MPPANRSRDGNGGPCVLYFTLAVDHRLAGRPPSVACAPSNSLQPPSSGRLGARSALQTALLPLPSFLPSIFRPPSGRSVNRAQCWFGLFGPFFARGALRVVAPLLASCLHSHTFTLRLFQASGGKKELLFAPLKQPGSLALPSLSLPAHSLLSGNSSGEI